MRDLFPELCDIILGLCAYHPPTLLALSQLSARWRGVALSNPALWTNIHINALVRDTLTVRLFLARSANLPLKIAVAQHSLRDKLNYKMMIVLLQQFVPHMHRIQCLTINLVYNMLPVLLGTRGYTRSPALKVLRLLVDDPTDGLPDFASLISPNLKYLRTADITLIDDIIGPRTLACITTLIIDQAAKWKYAVAFPPLLAACLQLQTCHIAFPESQYFVDVEPIELPELLDLTLEWPYLFHAPPIFRAFRAPKLRSLRIIHQARRLSFFPDTLACLLGLIRSAPGLTTLTIEGCNIDTAAEARVLFAACHALEHITVLKCMHVERFLAPLTPDSPQHVSSWLCPRLTHVTVGALEDADARLIVRFALSRATPPVPTLGVKRARLQELALQTEMYALTRKARLILLSGLMSVHHSVHIVGPFGALFDKRAVCA